MILVIYVAGFIALCLWVWYWHRWIKRHPGQGVDGVLMQRARQWSDQTGARTKISRHWASMAIFLGVVLIVWGLSGWSSRGLLRSDRQALALGAALVAVGWLWRGTQR